MNVQSFKPKAGYLVVQRSVPDEPSSSALQIEENTDDFLVTARVISDLSVLYPRNTEVVFEELFAQAFRDGSTVYYLIREDDIVGTIN